jgi:AhpD family alkylhydroperoxidase
MEPRFDIQKAAKEPLAAMFALEKYLHSCGMDLKLLHLIKIRASQINGCAYCLNMHNKEARAIGETEQRLYTLNAWRETPFFSARERAALAWAEAVTRIGKGVPDAVFHEAREHFSEKELADITWATVAINSWNRIAISSRAVPGTPLPPQHA